MITDQLRISLRRHRLAFALGLFCVFVLAACEERPSLQRANVILFSIETLRADRLGSYGNKRPITPTLDKLAARGVRFQNAFPSDEYDAGIRRIDDLLAGFVASLE